MTRRSRSSRSPVLEIARPELLFPIDDDRVQQAESPDQARAGAEFVLQTRVLQIRVLRANDPALVVGVLRRVRVLKNVRRDANRAVLSGGHFERQVRAAEVEQIRAAAAKVRLRRRIRLDLPIAENDAGEIESSRRGRGCRCGWCLGVGAEPGNDRDCRRQRRSDAQSEESLRGESLCWRNWGKLGPGRCYRFRHSSPNLIQTRRTPFTRW